ncbi:MAG: DUF4157 domain-containing protein [Gammaproteobacteria bacterium]|nr:MAG: DUF4157 domain-containing protein [Gammaproteobacteria bacterium]
MKKREAEKSESSSQCPEAICQEVNGVNRQQQIKNILYASSAKGKLKFGSSGDASEKQADSAAAGFANGDKTAPYKTTSVNNSATTDLGISEKGSALPNQQKQQYESYFGQSLSNVKIHTDSESAYAADAVNAKAFTLGNNIYFGQGQYSPNTQHGQEILTHEIAHTMQTDSGNTLRKWGAREHRRYGNIAGQKLVDNKKKFLEGLSKVNASAKPAHSGLAYGDSYSIRMRHEIDTVDEHGTPTTEIRPTDRSLGWASENAGDHSSSAEYLDKNKYGAPAGFTAMISPYVALARSNWNHFFPLAEKEWDVNHKTAKGYAIAAKRELTQGKFSKAEESMHKALTTEAFALHFLQDSFASGHQYPRAFDRVFDGSSGRPQTYHDILCDVESGINMRYSRNTSHKFRGDNTGTDKDAEIVGGETYNSIAEIYCEATGTSMSDVGAKDPKVNPGPDIPKIMKDPVAGPIWYAMETDIKKFTSGKVKNETVTTTSGKVTATQAEIMNAWRAAHTDDKGKELTTDQTLALGKDNNPETRKFYEAILHDPGFLKSNTDEAIIKFLLNDKGQYEVSKILKLNLPVSTTKHVLKLLLNNPNDTWDGACVGEDEVAVIAILYYQTNDRFRKIVSELGMDIFDNSIQGENWDVFLYMCTLKCSSSNNIGADWIAKNKEDDAARWLTRIRSWRGIATEPVPYRNVSRKGWVGIIRALLSGSCGDDDEDSIVYIVRNMVKAGDGAYLASKISKDEMDSGVDWGQWDTIKALMSNYW